MSSIDTHALVVANTDYETLLALIDRHRGEAADSLDEELARAEVVPARQLPGDVVAINSRVTFRDLDSGEETTVTLVVPHQVDVAAMKISLLSPVGCALIGLRRGACIQWPIPGGKHRRLQVMAVEQHGGDGHD